MFSQMQDIEAGRTMNDKYVKRWFPSLGFRLNRKLNQGTKSTKQKTRATK